MVPSLVWRQSKLAWLAFIPDCPDPHGEQLTKKVPASAEALCAHLLEFGGNCVCLRFDEKDCKKLLTQGHLIEVRGVQFQFGEPGQCHSNSAMLWRQNRKSYRIVTGYALTETDGIWRQHSCVLDANGTLVETTEERSKYYGLILSGWRAWQFANQN